MSLLSLCVLPACRLNDQTRSPAPVCTPFSAAECACGLSPGSMRCGATGVFETCRCDEPIEHALLDAGTAAPSDASVPSAAQGADAIDAAVSDELPCEISALLRKNCSMCHGAQPAFGAPMSLVRWDDLQKAAARTPQRITRDLVLERIQSEHSPMPPAPWPRVSPSEIEALARWLNAGAPKGACKRDASAEPDEAGMPLPPKLPKPADCEATYELKAHGANGADDASKFRISSMPARDGNQYHCFYFKPPYPDGSGMLWFEPILDDTASLHHWILYASDNATNAAGTSGPCNGAAADMYFVAGWAPGANNVVVPPDVSLALPSGPNAGLILEVHYYNNTGMAKLDATGLRFCTAKQSARPHTAGVHFLGSEGICIPPAARAHEVTGVCTPRADRGDIHITGLWPHMHKLARRQRVLIKRRGGASEVLHDQPFDFNAQIFYATPDVVIKPGDRIETTCFYDNDGNHEVSYGERTDDEMCYAFVTAWPAGALSAAPLFGSSVFQVNRCGEDLSILASCHGLDDSPTVVTHPP